METKEQIVTRLENIVRKVKIQTQFSDDVECRVHPPTGHGHPYVIEIWLDRFSRRISVDSGSLQRMDVGQGDPLLMRELRTAILAVTRLSRRR